MMFRNCWIQERSPQTPQTRSKKKIFVHSSSKNPSPTSRTPSSSKYSPFKYIPSTMGQTYHSTSTNPQVGNFLKCSQCLQQQGGNYISFRNKMYCSQCFNFINQSINYQLPAHISQTNYVNHKDQNYNLHEQLREVRLQLASVKRNFQIQKQQRRKQKQNNRLNYDQIISQISGKIQGQIDAKINKMKLQLKKENKNKTDNNYNSIYTPTPQKQFHKLICLICQVSQRNCLSIPCNHLATCYECGLNRKQCPVCDRRMTAKKIFVP